MSLLARPPAPSTGPRIERERRLETRYKGDGSPSAQLDFAQQLFGAKSPSEALELWTGHTRKQLETFQSQAKELVELTQRVAAETAEPIKASASKFYKPAA